MADSFAPKIQTQIAPEQPVQMQSMIGGLGSLVGSFLDATKPTGRGSYSHTEALDTDKAFFYSELDRARALIEQDPSRRTEASRIVTNAYRSFNMRWGAEHEDVNDSFSDFTGIGTQVYHTNDAFDEATVASRPEFQSTVALVEATNPDASQQDIYRIALQKTREQLALEEKVRTAKTNQDATWLDVENSYINLFNTYADRYRLMLQAAGQDQILTAEEADGIKQDWNNTMGRLRTSKPVGVSQEDWNSFTSSYLDPIESIFGSTMSYILEAPLSDVHKQSLDTIFALAASRNKIPPTLLMRLQFEGAQGEGTWDLFLNALETVKDDDGVLKLRSFIDSASYDELLGWVREFDQQTDLSFFDLKAEEARVEDFTSLSLEEKMEMIEHSSAFVFDEGDMGKSAVGVIELLYQVENLQTEAITPQDFNRVFGKGFYDALSAISEANPVIGEELTRRAKSVIDGHLVAISSTISSMASQLGFTIQTDGTLTINPAGHPSTMVALVDKYYGGDWDAAYKDSMQGDSRREATRSDPLKAGLLNHLYAISREGEKLNRQITAFSRAKAVQEKVRGLLPEDLRSIMTETPATETPAQEEQGEIIMSSKGTMATGSEEQVSYASEVAAQYGIPEDLFMAMIHQESRWKQGVTSSAGAIGLAQLMPGTAKELGVDPHDWKQNLEGGARYLRKQYDRFGRWDLALAAYNAGPNRESLRRGEIPDIRETQDYVRIIMGNYEATQGAQPQAGGVPAGIKLNEAMNPLVDTMEGASSMVHENAVTNMQAVLTGPFAKMQELLGFQVTINDAIAKAGTTRETETRGSQHFHGNALDISLEGMSDEQKLQVFRAALAAGFQGFGFGNNILHIDVGSKRFWAYGINSFGGMDIESLAAEISGSTVPAPTMQTSTTPDGGPTPSGIERDDGQPAPSNYRELSPDGKWISPAQEGIKGSAEGISATATGEARSASRKTNEELMQQLISRGVPKEEINSFATLEEARGANLPDGSLVLVKGEFFVVEGGELK